MTCINYEKEGIPRNLLQCPVLIGGIAEKNKSGIFVVLLMGESIISKPKWHICMGCQVVGLNVDMWCWHWECINLDNVGSSWGALRKTTIPSRVVDANQAIALPIKIIPHVQVNVWGYFILPASKQYLINCITPIYKLVRRGECLSELLHAKKHRVNYDLNWWDSGIVSWEKKSHKWVEILLSHRKMVQISLLLHYIVEGWLWYKLPE